MLFKLGITNSFFKIDTFAAAVDLSALVFCPIATKVENKKMQIYRINLFKFS